MNPWLMWSGSEAAGGLGSTRPALRRGYVWLAQVPPDRRQRAVLLLSRDRDDRDGEPLLVAPLVSGVVATGRVAVESQSGFDGAVVDVRLLTSIDRSSLIQPIARLAAPCLAEVEQSLCDVLGLDALGLDVPAWPSVPEVEAEPPQPDEVVALPTIVPAGDGVGKHGQPSAAQVDSLTPSPSLDRLGFGPPPAPPPLVETAAPPRDPAMDGDNSRGGLDDHPIAQLFGRPRPAAMRADPVISPALARARATRAADVMPELLSIVQRRLHRSAPRLEALLSQAADEGRSVEWAAAAVRHASVRGVMQPTLDQIATEIATVGAGDPAS